MEMTHWLIQHGESLLESVGIVGGLIFTGVGLHRDARAKRIENLFTITQSHRDIWQQAMEAPELMQVQDKGRDVLKAPPTDRERMFVRSLVLHLSAVYRAMKMDELLKPHGMERNIRAFFAIPVPRLIWHELREYQDPDFVSFVEVQLK